MISTRRLIENEQNFLRRLVCNRYARLQARTTYGAMRDASEPNTFHIDKYIDGYITACVASVSYYGGTSTGRWKAFIRHGLGGQTDRIFHAGTGRCGVPSVENAMHLWRTIDYSD